MTSRRLLPLDGLRGLAILLVFLFHTAGGAHSNFLPLRVFGLINQAGWTGVTLFFILSGFLITGILWDGRGEAHWTRNFYARRALRILPLYYAALSLVLLGAAVDHSFRAALTRIWPVALFLQDIPGPLALSIHARASPLQDFHFWSLAVEEQFYLLWPVLLVTRRTERSALRLCAAVFLFSAAFRVVAPALHLGPGASFEFLLSRSGELAAGSWLAMAYRMPLWKRLHAVAGSATVIGLGGFLLVALYEHSAVSTTALMQDLGLPLVTLGLAALLALTLEPGAVERAFTWRPLRFLGVISYGIYIFHVLLAPIYGAIATRLDPGSSGAHLQAAQFVVNAVGTLVISWLTFRFFETPILRLKRHFSAATLAPAIPDARY